MKLEDFKPNVLSVKDMYIFYISEKIKSNHSLFRNPKGELCYSSSKELDMIGRQIEAKKDEYGYLLEKDNKSLQDMNDISDIDVALKNFELKKKELQKDITKVKKIMDYILFKKILKAYNTKAGDRIINGEKFNLLNGLGYILGKRIERTHSNQKVDWGETNKLRDLTGELPIDAKTGKKKLIYFIDDEYCRVGWKKVHGIKNISVYGFEPAGGETGKGFGKGFKKKFSKAINDNPLLKLKFEYFPICDND